jgi:hypothetical protein
MSLSGAAYPIPGRNLPEPEVAAYAMARRMQFLRIEIESHTSGEGRYSNGERGS